MKSPTNPEHRQALELWLQARREELAPRPRQHLEALLLEDDRLAAEAARMGAFLDRLGQARLVASAPFTRRLKSCLEALVRDDVLAQESVAAGCRGAARGRFSGRRTGQRRLLQRSLAVAAGVLLGFLLYLGLADHRAPRKMLLTPEQADLLPAPHPSQARPR